jgi:hypothetical protein
MTAAIGLYQPVCINRSASTQPARPLFLPAEPEDQQRIKEIKSVNWCKVDHFCVQNVDTESSNCEQAVLLG